MAGIPGNDDHEKLTNLCQMTYKEQAIWFLNAFWDSREGEAEKLWAYVQKCNELDLQDHEKGAGLDEMRAHVFLESFSETLTVREMREKLRSTGAIGEKERPKLVPLTHYLLFKYNENWHSLANTTLGDNQEELRKAQDMLNAAQAACKEAEATEKAAKQAKRELDAALAELKAQEDAYNAKTTDLQKKSETGGVVSRNKAKAELEIHLAEDPLPLRRAKITTEAAVKKADRTKAAAEAALAEARARVDEAEAYLQEVKSRSGSSQGSVWWMERELHEARKYLPMAKGGIAK